MDRPAVDFSWLKKYKYLLIFLAIGVILMIIPDHKQEIIIEETDTREDVQTLDCELAELLSQMEGAGKVSVLLSKTQGEEVIFQTDEDSSNSADRKDMHNETVILNSSERDQTGLIRRIDPPVYRGAIILCQGADSPLIRLQITEAVSAATGLNSNQISVLKMK